ncbi:hypothetical protein BIV25_09585 [Streptomyces sp. MUSC 14]|uniref:DUF3068 domain-containing protein n=1 Tax=Streptomyces sp. MUSC 14 TaxID=1354889 RepID=UPI0008F59AA4|nr:DUF3068 domain-containing protein [Streptomyces sp. MUSC 14]OIJ99270.1 hypothetical protein BIV25_09585 [Streptomyces sp. MUSC 14]
MLRRIPSPFALALVGSGVFLLALASLLAWYVGPRVRLTPTDIDVTSVMTGRGSYFDTDVGSTTHDRTITLTRRVLGDVRAGASHDAAVWDVSTTIDTPKTLPLKDPRRSLQWSVERWVSDRRTNMPVHCCGETPSFDADAFLKFPFDVRKQTYRWWDSTLGGSVPLRYTGTQRVLGHEGYRFTGSVRPTRIGSRQVPGILVGLPRQGQVFAEEWYADPRIALVVDQRTGEIVDASIAPNVTLRRLGGRQDAVTLLQSDALAMTDATRKAVVDRAVADAGKLRLVGQTLPLAAAGVGGPLAVMGLVMLLVRGRRKPHGDPSGTPLLPGGNNSGEGVHDAEFVIDVSGPGA